MGITICWHEHVPRIIIYTLDGAWTWDQVYEAIDQTEIMTRSVAPERVDSIADMRTSGSVPIDAMKHLKTIANRQQDNDGLSVLVTESAFVLSLFNIATAFYNRIGRYFRVSPTIEEAFALILEDRIRDVLT